MFDVLVDGWKLGGREAEDEEEEGLIDEMRALLGGSQGYGGVERGEEGVVRMETRREGVYVKVQPPGLGRAQRASERRAATGTDDSLAPSLPSTSSR